MKGMNAEHADIQIRLTGRSRSNIMAGVPCGAGALGNWPVGATFQTQAQMVQFG
jgi:hypothetical protein